MPMSVHGVVPVLPAADVAASLDWWTTVCGFTEVFRHGTPASYAGIEQGPVSIHFAQVTDAALARTVGEQTMLRLAVQDIHAYCAEYQARGGKLHPNGGLEEKPWGGVEFSVIDPCGVCVSFREQETA